jgi:hypothetical protein
MPKIQFFITMIQVPYTPVANVLLSMVDGLLSHSSGFTINHNNHIVYAITLSSRIALLTIKTFSIQQ